MVHEVMLTTIDNPYNPFTQFREWDAYDRGKGYYTCAYLARIADVSSDMPDSLQKKLIHEAIDEICRINLGGIYKKAEREI